MEYVELGKTGLKVSRMGFGGIPIQRVDAEKTRELVRFLVKEGVNFFDTARAYTVSEEYLGYALEGIRDQVVLATKTYSRTREGAAADLETSLKNLRTDYIDLYQIHNITEADWDKAMGEDGALATLLEAREAGKIGHLGITVHSAEMFERVLEQDWVETIMFPYNIVEQQGAELIDRCKERGIGFICMKPLAGGAIDDASLALRFVCRNPAVTVVIPGISEREEFLQNKAACEDGSLLTDEELRKIEEIRNRLGNDFCRRCNYCAPCRVGISIPSVFLFAGYLERYDLADWGRERYATLKVKASACVKCGDCEPRCPYHLPIRAKMQKVAEEFGE